MNPHERHPTSPASLARTLFAHRRLFVQLAQREVSGRYRGSIAGLGWSLLNPLLMLAVYTFVFSVVFKARWGGAGDDSRGAFAVVLFVGILVHGIFAECLNRAPTVVMANANYVKKVVFPLEILLPVNMGAALFHAAVTLVVLLGAQLLVFGAIPVTALWLPLVLLPLLLTTLGLSWLLAGVGVYVRDIGQLVGVLTTVALFLAPVFYPVDALPENVRPWLYLNPLTFIIEQARAVLLWGMAPDWVGLLKHGAAGLAICVGGYWAFQRLRKGFADVL